MTFIISKWLKSYFSAFSLERATEIEKNNLNLFNKMRAIIRTKHSTWRNKMMNRKYQQFIKAICVPFTKSIYINYSYSSKSGTEGARR